MPDISGFWVVKASARSDLQGRAVRSPCRPRLLMLVTTQRGASYGLRMGFRWPRNQVRNRLSPGGRWIRTSGTADDARLLAELYTHNASRQMPQKGSSDQAVACLRRLGAGVVGSAAVCAFRFRPPGTGS